MKEQRFAIRLHFTGISIIQAEKIINENESGRGWEVHMYYGKHIALTHNRFLSTDCYEHKKPGENKDFWQVVQHSIILTTPCIGIDDIHIVSLLYEQLYKNGAVCIESYPLIQIVEHQCRSKHKENELKNAISDRLANSILLRTVLFFEPLKRMFIDYSHRGDKQKIDAINNFVKQVRDENLDIWLAGVGAPSMMDSLKMVDCIKNSIWI